LRLAQGVIGIAGWILGGLAACSAVLGLWLASNSLLFARDVARATGVVVGYRDSATSGGGRAYTPQVEFVDARGVRHTFYGQVTAPVPRFAARADVPVRYLRDEPSRARIDLFVDNLLAPGVALALAALSALAAAVLVRSARRELGEPT
jgi:hypothetical protein